MSFKSLHDYQSSNSLQNEFDPTVTKKILKAKKNYEATKKWYHGEKWYQHQKGAKWYQKKKKPMNTEPEK